MDEIINVIDKEIIRYIKNNFIEKLLVEKEDHFISAGEMKLINDFYHYIIQNLGVKE